MSSEAILIIDDNRTNLKLAQLVLQTAGYNVSTALDADEALELLKSFRPDLILMDIQLPGMDGLELTRRLKSDSATRKIPIVALTAYAMKGDQQKTTDAGCDGYIGKPIDTRSLPQLVRQYLYHGEKSALS